MDSKTEFQAVEHNQEEIVFAPDGQILLVIPGGCTSWEVVTNAVLNAEESTPIDTYPLTAVSEGGAS